MNTDRIPKSVFIEQSEGIRLRGKSRNNLWYRVQAELKNIKYLIRRKSQMTDTAEDHRAVGLDEKKEKNNYLFRGPYMIKLIGWLLVPKDPGQGRLRKFPINL